MRATPNLSASCWRKSSYSGNQEGSACVWVADGIQDLVPVRDSKASFTPALAFTSNAWKAFITAVKSGAAPVRPVASRGHTTKAVP
ncbi:DUF397 domain-containing protein [Streptomyces sp. NPDC056785]|uniref:DUF397 domain-containing protein n=1 Tax=Streptomyces sp. NPDC056785 TaxID=3345944 RepID=UPI0036C1DAE6